MKASQVKVLVNKSLGDHADFKAWTLKNHLLYKPIEKGLLVGVYFNSSGFSPDKFEVMAFVQPLFVPSSHIDLSYGINVKTPENRQWWQYDKDQLDSLSVELSSNLVQVEKNFLSKFNNSESFYKFFQKNKSNSFRSFEAVAYSAAYAGLANAKAELTSLLTFLERKEDMGNKWVKEVYENTRLILSDNPLVVLNQWEVQTRANLKL